jgi:hypothetical protein
MLFYTFVYSLEDVLLQESKLYLVFEFLSMDLKKYLDSIPRDQSMDPMLVKVCAKTKYCEKVFHVC